MNFNGSTGRRNVNLGKRYLMNRNKSLFLKSTQEEREKREANRRREKAASIIQASVRRKLDLDRWRRQLVSQWDGKSVSEFKYFFPSLSSTQDLEESLNQIDSLIRNLKNMTQGEINTCLNILLETLCSLKFKDNYIDPLLILICRKIPPILNSLNNPMIPHNTRAATTQRLLKIYCTGNSEILYFLCIKAITSTEDLLPLFTNSKLNPYESAQACDFVQNFMQTEASVTEGFISITETIQKLSDSQKVAMLLYYSNALNRQHSETLTISLVRLIPLILTSISKEILIDFTEEESVADHDTTAVVISKNQFQALANLFERSKIPVPSEQQLEYVSSLLHFSSLFRNDDGSLKTAIILTWILYDNPSLLKQCFDIIPNDTYSFRGQDHISNQDLRNMIDPSRNKVFWQSILIFNEFFMSHILYTPDSAFLDQIMITESDLVHLIEFLKLFVSQVLLRYRDIDPPTNQYFLSSFKKLLTLTHALYTKNLTLKFVDPDIWITKNVEWASSSIKSAIPAIESVHQSLMMTENTNSTDNAYDFLKSGSFIHVFQKVPKKVVDILYLLTYAFYMIPFDKRTELFHSFIEFDKQNNDATGWFPTKVEGKVSRDSLLFDAYKSFGRLRGTDFKKPFSVQFINQFGEAEAGIDGGGLTKELLTSLVDTAIVPSDENRKKNKNLQFFSSTTDNKLYFNPEFYFKFYYEKQHPNSLIPYAYTNYEYLDMCHFFGMVIGKCLYDNVLLDLSFAPFFFETCAKLGGILYFNLMGDKVDVMSAAVNLNELKGLDISLYNSLIYILKQNERSKFDAMEIPFAIDGVFFDSSGVQHHVTVPLGNYKSDTHVTPETRMHFVKLMTNFKINVQSRLQMKAFAKGLFEVIKPHWLLLFDFNELQTLISGDAHDIDLDDLKANVVYGGGYTSNDKTVKDLFEILEDFDQEMKGKFLKFVTSSSKKPLLGFKELSPNFGIFKAGDDVNRLPTASTCVNLLKLPDYKNKRLLREKLLYSINSKAGFDLS